MKTFLAAATAAVSLAVAGTPAMAGYAGYACTNDYGVAGRLNERAAPTTSSRVIGYYDKGANVPLTGWSVVYGGGIPWLYTTYGGWVRADYVCRY